MALQSSGAISLDDIHVELGATSCTQVSLNDTDVRDLISSTAGTEVSLSDFYGASARTQISLVISSNTNNYNIYSSRGGTYTAGTSDVTVTINSGVTVGSTSTGAYAMDTGSGWTSGDTITIVNNGTIKGRGGNGGAGGNASYPNASSGNVGQTGGDAFVARTVSGINYVFTNNGSVYGGGGGGGGGGGASYATTVGKDTVTFASAGDGGGGGAGVNGGSGGSGGSASGSNTPIQGDDGNTGTATAGGAGGDKGGLSGAGGSGGGLGSNGSSGGNGTSSGTNGTGGGGGTRGYYQVGSANINSGSGIGGTVGGRSQ